LGVGSKARAFPVHSTIVISICYSLQTECLKLLSNLFRRRSVDIAMKAVIAEKFHDKALFFWLKQPKAYEKSWFSAKN
jgi:hypothetical protein